MATKQIQLKNGFQPYPEYRDSGIEWIGKIPKDWSVSPMRSLFQNKKESIGKKSDQYKLLGLTLNGVVPRPAGDKGKHPENYETYQAFKADDLVMCLFDYDVTPRTVGHVREDGMLTGAYTRLIPKGGAYSRYYYYLYLSLDQTKELLHLCTGLRSSISKPVFWSMKHPQPSLETQKKIAAYLDEKTALIDRIIEKKKRLAELLRERRTAIIDQVVTRGLDHGELVSSGIKWLGKIPAGWGTLPLKRLLMSKITDGPHTTPVLLDEGVPFISAESIQENNTIDFNKRRGFISANDHKGFCRKSQPQRNDIFMVKSGATTGRIGIVKTDEEFSIWSPLALIRPKKTMILPDYLFSFLTSTLFQDQVKISWSFGTQQNIGMGVIENLLILFPDVQKQEQIVQFINKKIGHYDQAISLVEKSIETLKKFKSSLISNVVTGKVQV